MIICEECGEVFREEELVIKDDYDVGYRAAYCPFCHEQIRRTEARECERCGEYIQPDERFCPECKEEIKEIQKNLEEDMGVDEETLGELIADYYGW